MNNSNEILNDETKIIQKHLIDESLAKRIVFVQWKNFLKDWRLYLFPCLYFILGFLTSVASGIRFAIQFLFIELIIIFFVLILIKLQKMILLQNQLLLLLQEKEGK